MAERPYDWGVLCLRPKSSLCNCRQLLCVRQAVHRTSAYREREVGVLRRGWITFGEYFTGKGRRPPTTVGIRKIVIALSCGVKIYTVHHLVLS